MADCADHAPRCSHGDNADVELTTITAPKRAWQTSAVRRGNAWSHEGKLLQTQTKDASGQVNGGAQNSFDGAGNRVAQKVALTGGGTKTTSYLVDETAPYAAVVEERAPDVNDAGAAKLQARYVLGGGLAPVAMWRKMADGVAQAVLLRGRWAGIGSAD